MREPGLPFRVRGFVGVVQGRRGFVGFRACLNPKPLNDGFRGLLGGSWVVISGVISPLI